MKELEILALFIFRSRMFSLPLLSIIRTFGYSKLLGCERPFVIRNNVHFSTSHSRAIEHFTAGKNLIIQDNCFFDISSKITIGENVTISHGSEIYTHLHDIKERSIHDGVIKRSRIVIEDEVWIGSHAIILPSVKRIGYGAVIGAGSVVTKDVEPLSMVAGNPAKNIGNRKLDK